MSIFIELLVNGISLGFLYALLALGFVVIYKATEVINFAHGSMMLLGIYVVARSVDRFGFAIALALGLLAAAAFAVLMERLVISTLRRRGASHDAALIVTIGVDIMMMTDLTRRIGPEVLDVSGPWRNDVVHWAGLSLPLARLVAIGVSVAIIVAFFLALKYTTAGISMRATAENPEAATLMGIRLNRVAAMTWLIAGLLACLAGVFLTSFPSPGFTAGAAFVALNAFPAAMVGGLDSVHGALVGGLIVGMAETLTTGYSSHLLFLGQGFGSIVPWVVMILVLLVKPAGLFGAKEATRV